jgi:hypothetical protein
MLPRMLFRLVVGMSFVLILLVIVSPFVHERLPRPTQWSRFLDVFAQDPTLRRTASAAAIGLLVTACIFFRQPGVPAPYAPKQGKLPPPPNMAGA